MYLMHGLLVAYCALTSALVWPDDLCVTILPTIFLCPMFYLDKSWRVNLITLLYTAFYVCFISIFKSAAVLYDEVLDTVTVALLGGIIGTYVRDTNFENFRMIGRLRMSDEEYRAVLKQSQSIIGRFDARTRTVTLQPETAAQLRMSELIADVPFGPVRAGRISADTADAYIAFYGRIVAGEPSGTGTFHVRTADGWLWLKGSFTTIFDDQGAPAYAVVAYQDVTEQRKKEVAFQKWQQEIAAINQQLATLFEWNLTQDVFENETGSLIHAVWEQDTCFNRRTKIYAGDGVYREDRARYTQFMNRERLLGIFHEGRTSDELVYRETRGDGFRWMRLTVQLVQYPDSNAVKAYIIFRDIDREKRQAMAVEELAREDNVTHLLNRAAFMSEADALLRGPGTLARHAFLMLDIDGFKLVNDTFGHMEGDRYLVEVAERLRASLRQDDLIARLGGDEFIVCMRGVSGTEAAEDRVRAIRRVLERKVRDSVDVSISIGVAFYPEDATELSELYRKADTALYCAKRAGKNRYMFYAEDMEGTTFVTNETPIDE